MRQESKLVVQAFIDGKRKLMKRTTTDGEHLWLHGNTIAFKVGRDIYWTLAGWNTPTTRERINTLFALLNVPFRVCQKNFEPYVYHTIRQEMTPINANSSYRIDWLDIHVAKAA